MVSLSLGSSHLTPPHILFVSSIAVLTSEPYISSRITGNTKLTGFPVDHTSAAAEEVPIDDPTVSVGTGYGESKWVAENILLRARKEADVRTTVVRVGQLCGDSVSGGWNEKEWVPALLRGSQVLGAFPQRKEVGIFIVS